jgi:hypothetical protein
VIQRSKDEANVANKWERILREKESSDLSIKNQGKTGGNNVSLTCRRIHLKRLTRLLVFSFRSLSLVNTCKKQYH